MLWPRAGRKRVKDGIMDGNRHPGLVASGRDDEPPSSEGTGVVFFGAQSERKTR